MDDSPRNFQSTSLSRSGSLAGGVESNPEEFVARFQTTKLSWKGKYERIFAISATRFCTIDPKDFDVTNSWPFHAFISLELDPNDEQVFILSIQGPKKEEQLKLRYKYRAYLLTEFLRLHAACLQTMPRAPAPIQWKATKLTRHGTERECVLEVAPDGLVYKEIRSNSDPIVMERYRFTDIEHLTPVTNTTTGCVVGYGGKQTIFYTSDRPLLLTNMEKSASRLGVRIASRGKLTVEQVAADEPQFEPSECIVQFPVQKLSIRHAKSVRRVLALVPGQILELENKQSSTTVVSAYPLRSIFGVVRHPGSSQFEIEFINGTQRMYNCHDRDGVLAAIYDALRGEDQLEISSTPSLSGLRLLPRFAVEDTTESTSFFGDSSIGACFLKRLAAVGKFTSGHGIRAGVAAGRGLVSIATEFNANVPMSGIQYNTKRSIILEALKPLVVQLHTVATCQPPAPRMTVTLLQCICRITSSFYGFRELLHMQNVSDSLLLLLQADDELTIFWSALLIQRLTMHSTINTAMTDGTDVESVGDKRSTNSEAEMNNKKMLLGQEKIITALVAILLKFEQHRAGPLGLMGNLKVFEGALCTHRNTTDGPIVHMIVDKLVPHYNSLTKLLFWSRCATTVESCTLLIHTVLRLCSQDDAATIKDATLRQGLVLQHLYQAMFDPSFDQRCVSRYMISMWMSDHIPAKQLLRRILPPGLVSCLDMRLLSPAEIYQLDDLEKSTFMDKFGAFNAELLNSRRSPSEVTVDDDTSVDSFVSDVTASSKVLGQMSVKAKGNVFDEAANSLRESSPPPSPHVRHVFKDGFFNLKMLKQAIAHRLDRGNGLTPVVDDRSPEDNFRILFHMVQQDHESIDLVWTQATREELRNALVHEIHELREASTIYHNVVWNYEDFTVPYTSLDAELVVDGLYLRHILSCEVAIVDEDAEDTWSPPLHLEEMRIKKPKRFVSALYKKLLREYGEAEFKGNMEWTLACLKSLTMVTWMYQDGYLLPTEDLCHILLLLRQTTRRDLLVHLLHALRSITRVPTNGAKILKDPSAIPLLVELLQMAHTSQRYTSSNQPTKALWTSPDNGGVPKTIDELRAWLYECGKSPDMVRIGNNIPLNSIAQLKWELLMDRTFDSISVAHDAIHILIALLKSNPLVSTNVAVYPIPLGRQLASVKFADIASILMLFELPHLSELAMHVLVHLSLDSDQFYWTGVYYFLFLYKGMKFQDFSNFLQLTHKTQATPIGKLRHILGDLLPLALIVQLDTLSKEEFAALFCSDISSPRVIWNQEMRQHLWNCCFEHLEDHRLNLQQEVSHPYRYDPMARVIYDNLQDELFCHGFYLGQFCTAQDVDVKDPANFLHKLAVAWSNETQRVQSPLSREQAMETLGCQNLYEVRKKYKELCSEVCPERAEGDTQKLEQYELIQRAYGTITSPRDSLLSAGYDATNLILILKTQVRLFRSYPSALASTKFEAFPSLLDLLESHCSKTLNVPSLTTADERMEIILLSVELLCQSCSVSSQNSGILLNAEKRDVVEQSLSYCVDHVVDDSNSEAEMYTIFSIYLMQTIAGLATTASGRLWIQKDSLIMTTCWRILWHYHKTSTPSDAMVVLVRYTLEALCNMSESLEMQEILLKTGIVWHLLWMWLAYDGSISTTDCEECLQRVILTSKTIEPLGDLVSIRNAFAVISVDIFKNAKSNLKFQTICNKILTPNLYFQSTNPSIHQFLNLFTRNTRSHRLIWTEAMRIELKTYLNPLISASCDAYDDQPVSLQYQVLCEECIIDEIYINPLLKALTSIPSTNPIDFVRQLGLSNSFYESIVHFIRTGLINDCTIVGWGLDASHVLEFQGICFDILAIVAPLMTSQVEAGFMTLAAAGLFTLFSFVLPPGHRILTCRPKLVSTVPIDFFSRFQKPSFKILQALTKSKSFGDAIIQVDLFPVLMHGAVLEDATSSIVLDIVGNLCRNNTAVAKLLLSSIWFYHILLWIFPTTDESTITDNEYDYSRTMQLPAARILSIVANPTSPVLEDAMNFMVRFVPVALIYEMVNGPENIATILKSNYEAPDLVWNETLRKHCSLELQHLSILVNKCTDSQAISEELSQIEIDYSHVYPYPMVGDVYLLLYLENPIHPLRDSKFFLECLMQDFETLSQSLINSLSQRSSFSPDLIMAVRQQAQILPLLTSCIVCALRMYPEHFDDIATWKYPDKLCTLFVLLQNELKNHRGMKENEAIVAEISLLRLFRLFFVSPRIVSTLAYSPFNILNRLISHCQPFPREYHDELAFLLEIIRRFLLSFPDNGDKNSDKNVVAVVCGLNYMEFLLEIIEHPPLLQRVSNPILARTTIIATLNLLEQHRTQGTLAHHILKKHKKWDKLYRHEATDEIRLQPEDKFLVGVASGADTMIRNYLATKSINSSNSNSPVIHSSRKIPTSQKLKNLFR